MKVFLTGGTGFIGKPLTNLLLAREWEVTALVRNPQSQAAQALHEMGAQLSTGDVTNRDSMRDAMQGADMVIHNAGHYEFGVSAAGKNAMQAINVQGTENVLGLALALGVQRTVYVSTVWALGDSGPQLRDETFRRSTPCHTVYEKTKTDAHQIALQYQSRGLPLIIVCPNGVIGPNDHSIFGYFVRLYINKLLPPMGWSPESTFSLVELNDLAQGIDLAAEKGRIGETYFLCGEPTTTREMFVYWAEKPGAYKVKLWVPVWMAKFMFWTLEPLQRAFGLPAFLSRETVTAAASNLNYSSEKAKRELGWTHKTAREMWSATIEGEIELLSKRQNRSFLSRLNPL